MAAFVVHATVVMALILQLTFVTHNDRNSGVIVNWISLLIVIE